MPRRLLLLILLLGAVAAGLWAFSLDHLRQPLRVQNSGQAYLLRAGLGVGQVLRELEQQGVIRHSRWLSRYLRWQHPELTIKAGEYWLEPGLPLEQQLQRFASGEVVLHSVTFPEGLTFKQWLTRLQETPELSWDLGSLDREELWSRLGITEAAGDPEGRFFPDTYRFPRGFPASQLLRRAYVAMDDALAQAWASRSPTLPLESPTELLILASLVERETAAPQERGEIAGVFVRRLQRGMRLQTDPAVIYGLGDDFDGNLQRHHLKDARNPYNTYRHAGLPPTPIAAPGRASLMAAAQPQSGDTLYFVARGDGTHQFSVTLEQHQRAVRQYQIEARRSDYQSKPRS